MALITPTWTDNVAVIAAQILARGGIVRATLDLRGKWKAVLYPVVARTGTVALINGVEFKAFRTVNNGGVLHPNDLAEQESPRLAASQTSVNVDSAAAQNVLNVAATAAFNVGDLISIKEAAATVTRFEIGRVAAKTSGTLTLLSPLQFAHTLAQADLVHNKVYAPDPITLEGGATYELMFSYADDTAGDPVVVRCMAQTLDSHTSI